VQEKNSCHAEIVKDELLPSLFALPSTDSFPATSKRTSRARTEILHLERHQVLRLERTRQFKKLELRSGIVWLTSTPANGDVILQQSQTFEFQNAWPYVIEAIETAEISLTYA
jgi:hypothetical protein